MYLPPQHTRIAGLSVVYRRSGETGQDILFVHGWASSSRMWNHTMRTMGTRQRTWALDLPGFGDSEKPGNGWYAIDNWVDTIAEFCTQHGLSNPVVVGHSMGGTLALSLALRYPKLISRLVVINPIVTGRTYLDLRLLASSPVSQVMSKLGRWVWPIAISPAFSNPFGLRSRRADHYRRTQEDWAKVEGHTVIETIKAVFKHDLSGALPQIQHPTLVILGKHDMTAPNREGRLVAQRIAGAQLAVLKAGHLPTDDCPAATQAVLDAFIAQEQAPAGN